MRICAARKSYRDVGIAEGGRSGGHMRDAPGGPSPTGHSSEQLAEMSLFTVFHAKSKMLLTSKRYSTGVEYTSKFAGVQSFAEATSVDTYESRTTFGTRRAGTPFKREAKGRS